MNKEIKKYTEMFHYTYEMLALNFDYETRKDTKKFDFDTPNGKLMYATVEKIISPILEENKQLKEKYNIALKQLIEYNLPCEINGFNEKNENLEYCSINCGVDDNIYLKCWDRFIEQELEKSDS